ncbi:MAG TPA: hypothetical protein VEJ22_03150 [Nitrospirota bacterium]|nr:hypothetical protein [Nitrospirota bacterium]
MKKHRTNEGDLVSQQESWSIDCAALEYLSMHRLQTEAADHLSRYNVKGNGALQGW